ncbi:kinase-like protein [Teratosphaeria nubilosa]|uniref:Kinase-like protein n=1 Tax=Teratosphaeria nubilosa TaxID=161662 RepID=A0A6G1L551_9PEZI|nr:kinase-like protein [Teratosphaeria nubilosa]
MGAQDGRADALPATIALNAYIFGYGGHSLVTPHAALKQLWWTDKRIEAKITRSFVISKLRGEEREFLDKPLAFGEGLTDDTYMEWILERAKRLFLILTEIGVPDQIFGCIDDSWDDDDLPISLENVRNLELAYENDESLNRKFYDTQFVYLLRELKQGAHIDYGPNEHIPMEYVNTLPPAVSLQSWDRVHFPGRPDEIFQRRRYFLTDKDTGQTQREQFMKDVRKARSLGHEHVANVWASYTSDGSGYVLSNFVAEHTLGTFIDHRTPTQFMRVPVSDRPVLLCEWMHCLATAVASLHHRGAVHTAIRPSNIWIDRDNRIAFADIGTHRTFQRGKKPHKTEAYDYSAPESQICQSPSFLAASPPPSMMSGMTLPLPRPSYIDPDTLQDLPQPVPEMSDIYSLACIFLDIITFMIKGKLNDFIRFRGTRVSAPASKSKVRLDHSFHCNVDKIDAWIEILKQESERQHEQIFQGVPELLRLVRLMMAQNALLRPSAQEVRDRLQEILVSHFSIATGAFTPPKIECGHQRSRNGSISGDSVIGNSGQPSAFDLRSKRRSSASSMTATKMSAWRRVFTRST